MAKIPGKGTLLKLTISASLTTIAQVDSITPGAQDQEMVECDTLDNATADIPMQGTGRSSQADTSASMYYDPANATHQFVAATISDATPSAIVGSISLADSGPTAVAFSASGLGLGFDAITPSGLVKSTLTIHHNGLIDWPQS